MNLFKTILLATALLGAAALLPAGSMKPIHTDDFSTSNRGRWTMIPGAAWQEPGILEVNVPRENGGTHHKVTAPIDLSACRGQLLTFTIEAKADNVTQPPNRWNGIKFMLSYDSPSIGKNYHHPIEQFGTFDWKELVFTATVPDDITEGTLSLGLEESFGKVQFRNLKIYAFDRTQPEMTAEYSDAVRTQPALRGVMSPDRFRPGDFEELGSWGVNLIRWQFVRNWGKAGTDRNLAEYTRWIDAKLDELDLVLAAAERNRLKVIIDLHSPPGGRYPRSGNKDMLMFYDRRYAECFVELWRRIAERFKDRPAVWGYDLVNEPMQSRPTEFGYWELQFEAARAIRQIDPERPIIIESNNWCQPDGFYYLKPLPLRNIIYQVHVYNPGAYTHQFVHNDWGAAGGAELIPYPGMISGTRYDRETLRRILKPVRDFQQRHGARIYVGEFSAVRWAPGAERYLEDCISLFEEYGWDWTYHAFREWNGWSVEHTENPQDNEPAQTDTARKKVLLKYFRRNNR